MMQRNALKAPPPECPVIIKTLNSSFKLSRPANILNRGITADAELQRLSKSDTVLALKCPPLSEAAGPYQLNVSETDPVHLPERQSFLMGDGGSVMAKKRWKRSHVSEF